jgi:hypothetical protein
MSGTSQGKGKGTRPMAVAYTKKSLGYAVQSFIPGNLNQPVSHAFEGAGQAVGAVDMGTLVETLVTDMTFGVKIILVSADLHDSFMLIQGHDQATVAST